MTLQPPGPHEPAAAQWGSTEPVQHPSPLPPPPHGTEVVGGTTTRLNRVVALDRLASGYGGLTIRWSQRGHGLDLVALQEGSTLTVRDHAITLDLSQPVGRVLIGTGTRGTMPLPPSELLVSNGSTRLTVAIEGGTSLGVWPRLSITRVDGFLVVRHEHDPLSGLLGAVAGAYGYDERSFVLAHTT